ncbi:nucleotide-binding protein [Vogesella indigofera]|uniref:nucleotide-binding protein n=1 Tax=Vogesella indigofera TaxID=45465 RepID=UPI00234DB709|nr:nucleotide-binding protein [Vogesella indigofera]MDC7705385.1 nucleotide-binding protein [Vogesella indigofera]
MFSKENSIEKIKSLIERIDELQRLERRNAKFKKWIRDTQIALEHIFGNESRHITDFNRIRYSLGAFTSSTPEQKFQQRYVDGLEDARYVLVSMIEEIQEYWEEDGVSNESSQNIKLPTSASYLNSKKIFLIHGHDNGTKETVARFISQLGLEPIILHEQANQGRTVIEKFEDHSDVGYAIALITPDDTGSSNKDPDNVQHRARQNVIFEFGYFIGKLGRHKVMGLVKGDIEVPSDYSGVLYIPIDESGAWKFLLLKELKMVGYDVDANNAI